MSILYKQANKIGIRYPVHWLGLLFRLVLLSLAFVVHYAYINHKMGWESWLVPLLLIALLLSIGANKRKAVFSRYTGKLTVYGEWFDFKGLKYDLPAARAEIRIGASQRVEAQKRPSGTTRIVLMDIIAVTPGRTIELDAVQIENSFSDEASRSWEDFFDAVYNERIAEKFSSDSIYRFLQIATWVLFFGSCVAAFCLNHY